MFNSYHMYQMDVQQLDDHLWDEFYRILSNFYLEGNPDDNVYTFESLKKDVLDQSDDVDLRRWVIMKEDSIIAYSNVYGVLPNHPDYKDEKDEVRIFILVDPEYRRQGLGRYLFQYASNHSRQNQKTRAFIWTTQDEGKAFNQSLGGKIVYRNYTSRLHIADINWQQMDTWIETGVKHSSDTRMNRFEEAPEDILEDYCQLYTEVCNQAPAEDLEGEEVTTPESRRRKEKSLKDRGYHWITFITTDGDGIISGLTEIHYDPQNPDIVRQDLTGVRESHRGRRIGKWLKATMAHYIRENFPKAKFIQTGNAQSNEHMLRINNEMGFRTYSEGHSYRFDL